MTPDQDFLKLSNRIDKLRHSYEKRTVSEYRALYRDVRNLIGKYATTHGLTYAELQKYNRLTKLEQELRSVIRTHHVEIAKEIRAATRASLVTAHAGTMDIIGAEAGKKIRGILTPETITAIAQSPHSGMKLNARIEYRRSELVRSVQEAMTRGLVAGDRYETIAQSLQGVFEGDLNKTTTIIRTESHRVHEAGKRTAVERATNQGVAMEKVWRSSKDERVRASHAHMDGQVVDATADFVNTQTGGRGPAPGEMGVAEDDINCRCIAIYRVKTN